MQLVHAALAFRFLRVKTRVNVSIFQIPHEIHHAAPQKNVATARKRDSNV